MNTAVLLVGQNGGTAECFTQGLTVTDHHLVTAFRQHTLVIRELAVYKLRGKGELAGGRTDVVCAQHDADFAVRFGQQTRHFEDAFTRHDHLMAVWLADVGFH